MFPWCQTPPPLSPTMGAPSSPIDIIGFDWGDEGSEEDNNDRGNNNTSERGRVVSAPIDAAAAAHMIPTSGTFLPTPELMMLQQTSAIPDLLAALRNIPPEEKVEYLHALRVAPQLFETESDPVRFLRFCDWNINASARRLTTYWRRRVEIFGADRAYRPLLNDFSGNGALDKADMEVLQSGGYCMMPPDVHGRPVLFNDRRLIPAPLKIRADVKLRACFLVLQQMMMNKHSQLSGAIVIVCAMQTSDDDQNILRPSATLMREAFPVKVQTIHLVYLQERRTLMQSIAPFLLEKIGRFFSNKILLHNCEAVQQLVERLARHGLSRESLPCSVGGWASLNGAKDSWIPRQGLSENSFLDDKKASTDLMTIGGSYNVSTMEDKQQQNQAQPSEFDSFLEATIPVAEAPFPEFDMGIDVHSAEESASSLDVKEVDFHRFMDCTASDVAVGALDMISIVADTQDDDTFSLLSQDASDSSLVTAEHDFELFMDCKSDDTGGAFNSNGSVMVDMNDDSSFWELTPMRPVQAQKQQPPQGAALILQEPGEQEPQDALFLPQQQQQLQTVSTGPRQHVADEQDEDPNQAFFSKLMDLTELGVQSSTSLFDPTPIRTPPNNEEQQVATTTMNFPTYFSDLHASAPLPTSFADLYNAIPVNNNGEAAYCLDRNVPFVETPDMIKRSLTALNDALRGLPVEEQAAYNWAMQTCPAIIQTESDPVAYLRFDNFNAWAAAKRLALYWKYRVEYFGERACLPLTQTMGGALWEEDLVTLAAGSFFLLSVDSKGRPVLGCNPSKRLANVSKASQIRTAMYFFSILACEYPAARKDGCVILLFVSDQIMDLAKFDDTTRQATAIALDTFPIPICETHVIFSPSNSLHGTTAEQKLVSSAQQSSSFFKNSVLPVMFRALGRLVMHDWAHFYVRDTRDELMGKLVQTGLSGTSLQAAMNGGISDHEFGEWMKNRQLLELSRYRRVLQQEPGGQQQQQGPLFSLAQDTPRTMAANQNEGHPDASSPMQEQGDTSAARSLPVLERQDNFTQAVEMIPNPVRKTAVSLGFPETVMQVWPHTFTLVGGMQPVSGQESGQWIKKQPPFERHAGNRHDQQHQAPLLTSTAIDNPSCGAVSTGMPQCADSGSGAAKDIDEAMLLVPNAEKLAYIEAIEKVPDLVEKESNPACFLKLEKHNVHAAARNLAAYWRIRRKIFGKRAFLPMMQTSDGALDRKDLVTLQTGFLAQLPNDAAGCSVICYDQSKLNQTPSVSCRQRVFFYMWSLLLQNDQVQKGGYTLLYAMPESGLDNDTKECLDLVMEALPVKLNHFHLLCCCPDGTSQGNFRRGPVNTTMNMLEGSVGEKVLVHLCGSCMEFAGKLGCHGLPSEWLPKIFGGKWGLEDFVKWQELRILQEWNLPMRPSARLVAERYFTPSAAPPPLSSLTADEKAERKRRMDIIRGRRARERARIDIMALQERCSGLRDEQKDLLREGNELEILLQCARALVNEE